MRDVCKLAFAAMILFPMGVLAQLVKCRLPNGTLYIGSAPPPDCGPVSDIESAAPSIPVVHLDGPDLSPPRRRCRPRIDHPFGGLRGLRAAQLGTKPLTGVREAGGGWSRRFRSTRRNGSSELCSFLLAEPLTAEKLHVGWHVSSALCQRNGVTYLATRWRARQAVSQEKTSPSLISSV
jgi:hypothetical protein